MKRWGVFRALGMAVIRSAQAAEVNKNAEQAA
jgi:hypothetical protein